MGNTIKEIGRRCEFANIDGGMDGIDASTAEMEIEEDGVVKYLTCLWVSEASDGLCCEVSDVSIWDSYMTNKDPDEFEDLLEWKESHTEYCESTDLDEEYTGEYQEQFSILQKMVLE